MGVSLFPHHFGVNSRHYVISSIYRNRSPSLTATLALSILTPAPGYPPRDLGLFLETGSAQDPRQAPGEPLPRSCNQSLPKREPASPRAPVASTGERRGAPLLYLQKDGHPLEGHVGTKAVWGRGQEDPRVKPLRRKRVMRR